MEAPKLKIGINETAIDVVLQKLTTLSLLDFHSWITAHKNDLKQHEINMIAGAYYDGLTFEPFDRLTQTEIYCVQRFKTVPKIEEK